MYYYVTNLQGDVTNILDASGNVVASYTYNAWGKVLTATGSMASINPIRYRGYYFDSDTGLYYLKSRYYDPQIARFVNADDYVSSGQGILGCNMFAYCLNSPVVHADYTGNIAGILVATLTLAASNPLIAVALVTGTAVLLKLAFEAAARVVYEIGVASEHYNNAIYAAKKANSNNSHSGMVDVGGGAASPTPPGNGKNDRNDAKEFVKSPKNAKQVISYLKDRGFNFVKQEGSHVKLSNGSRTAIVPNHGAKDLAPGTLRSIMRQAGLL